MIEVGNGADFNCSRNLASCQAHLSMWAVMKAPLILGNDITTMSAATLSVLSNAEAIAVNQDPLGVQAKRVAVAAPANATLTADARVNLAVAARCDASRPTQTWFWANNTSTARDRLFLLPCDAADATQQWSFDATPLGTALRNVGAGKCVDAAGASDPAQVLPCAARAASQAWALQPSGHIASGARCLDVFNFVGPDVELGSCKAPGADDSNQVFALGAGGRLTSADARLPPGLCLGLATGGGGGPLTTRDAAGVAWGLAGGGAEGGWRGVPGAAGAAALVPSGHGARGAGPANVSLALASGKGGLGLSNGAGASGPRPHARWVASGTPPWTVDLAAAQTPAGSAVKYADAGAVIDDDFLGHVTVGGDFCLDLVPGGALETWAGPLAGGRVAVALWNRSPGADAIAVRFGDFGAPAGARFSVRDVWAAADRGVFAGAYTAQVESLAVALLVLTPA